MRFELAHKAVAIFVVLFASSSGAVEKADLVIVDKSEETLTLLKNAKALEKFHVVFGGNPKGHKQREGDERTPEGNYTLDYKKSDSAFYKAIHIA